MRVHSVCAEATVTILNKERRRRIDELEGRVAAINDKLSEVVNQFNDDKQKFKDEMELEFCPTQALYVTKSSKEHKKSLKDFDKQFMDCMSRLQTR